MTTTMAAFAALLDRSVVRIAELSADGRFFDRHEVATIADIWDNNTVPLLGALAGRTRRAREQRAEAALRWMADAGPARHAWMIEQAGAAGHRLRPVLGPAAPRPRYSRDHAGRVWPRPVPLTGAEPIAADYDLGAAVVSTVAVERAGPALGGHVALVAPRRYAGAAGDQDAVVHLRFDDIRAARFDSDDTAGVSLIVDDTGAEIRFGAGGLLGAASATVDLEDAEWHLSRAGRAADAETPAAGPPRVEDCSAEPAGVLWDAAAVLLHGLRMIRAVRYARVAGRIPLGEMCAAFADAGDRLLTAAGRPWWSRDRAVRDLMANWVAASPYLAGELHRSPLAPGHWLTTITPAGPRPVPDPPVSAQLTMARYTVPSARRNPASAIILAVPDGAGTWGLWSTELNRPVRMAMDISAFTTEHPCTNPAPGSIRLGVEALVTVDGEPGEATNRRPGTSSRA